MGWLVCFPPFVSVSSRTFLLPSSSVLRVSGSPLHSAPPGGRSKVREREETEPNEWRTEGASGVREGRLLSSLRSSRSPPFAHSARRGRVLTSLPASVVSLWPLVSRSFRHSTLPFTSSPFPSRPEGTGPRDERSEWPAPKGTRWGKGTTWEFRLFRVTPFHPRFGRLSLRSPFTRHSTSTHLRFVPERVTSERNGWVEGRVT